MAVGGAYEESSAHALFALILVPTRELAMQIEDQAKQLMRGAICESDKIMHTWTLL